jgi:hypothetical protein
VYALGLILHELLGGTAGADGRMADPPSHPPAMLAALIAAALDPEPRRRPSAQTATTALELLPSSPAIRRTHARGDIPSWQVDADLRPTCCERRPAQGPPG